MTNPLRPAPHIREIIPADKVQDAVRNLAAFLLEKYDFSKDNIALVGVQTRGVVLANRIAELILKKKGYEVPVGALDITLYRDDLSTSGIQPVVGETQMDFDIDDKQIILIDDVLFTGRTVRAALDEIMDFGRPKAITLAVLVDRGHRELPIEPQFSAMHVTTERNESVNLHLREIDGKEEIVITEAKE